MKVYCEHCFSPYGELIETKIVNETAFIEYKQKTEAQKSICCFKWISNGTRQINPLHSTTNEIYNIILNIGINRQQNNDNTTRGHLLVGRNRDEYQNKTIQIFRT
eukprot:TRINITY_DN10018_c0_g1_i1.p1 TRINITY_DN10018_c0_g1~~TRINITY_DN10018_c0_g1_i1.p1  ORF type:complete len:105 (-),score=2.61 TRINITY_DN10018_c0_g1_i1:209-523(-)